MERDVLDSIQEKGYIDVFRSLYPSKVAYMYCDKKDGSTVRTGWVVGFRVDNGLGEKYLQQDWVSVVEEQ